jgi:glyoxylase-like metal-dependent hydrolase (beta-lactamase superfamily II)
MHQWEAHLVESRYIKFLEHEKKADALLGSHGIPAAELDLTKAGIPSPAELVVVAMPDQLLYGGEMIRTGKYDLEVIWTPGHSPGQVCLYEPKNQLLFAGDHILPTITPNVSYGVYSGDNPLGDYLYALGKLANLPVRHVFPGHEEPFSGFQERVASIKEHHRRREAEIYNVITKQPISANEVASQLKWNMRGLQWKQFHPLHKRMATGEVIAHLEHLRWNGKICRVFEKDHIFYCTV